MLRILLVSCLAALASACQSQPEFTLPDGGFWNRTGLANNHLSSCDDTGCGDGTAVPVGGPHCATPLACRVYTDPQKPCAWVHNLEHGHAVLLYNCPQGCPDDVAALQRHWDAQLPRRIIVAPDPSLPRRIGAVVWGHGWLGDAYDLDAVRTILDQQDADAPEPGVACGT